MNELLTVHQPVKLGADGLFAVQGGITLPEAMDAMALLLSTARASACEMAQTCSGKDASGTAWALEHLLALVQAVNSSVHLGLLQGPRAASASEAGGP